MAEKTKSVITPSDYLKGRDKAAPLTEKMRINMLTTLSKINRVQRAWGEPMVTTSGYRPPASNGAAGGKPGSCHLTCESIDIQDIDGRLASWTMDNLKLMEDLGLYIEDPKYTRGWVHYQIRAPKSGKRVFIP